MKSPSASEGVYHMSLFDLFKRPAEAFSVTYDEEEEMTHGSWNNWECDDPDCCCHDAEESDAPISIPWQSLNERKQR